MSHRRVAIRRPVSPVGINELPDSLAPHVLEACAAPMIIIECRGNTCLVRYVNPAFARRSGYSAAEILQIGWDRLQADGGRERSVTQLCAAIRERRELDIPLRIQGNDGVMFSAIARVSPVGDPRSGGPRYAVGVLRERSADAEYVSRLEREAHYDPLTRLPNRRLLADRARRAIAQALREGQFLGVALIDLDGFKLVNDTLGHAAGDEVLCTVAARLARDLRPGDLVARVGGDEFVLLLQAANGDSSPASVVERVSRRIEQPIEIHGQSITIACSIGVAICPRDGGNLSTLLKHADGAMYRQKSLRRSKRTLGRASTRSPDLSRSHNPKVTAYSRPYSLGDAHH